MWTKCPSPLNRAIGAAGSKILNTLTNAYVTKFSSGLVLALLAVSGLLFMVPAALPASASNASLPSISISPNVLVGISAQSVSIVISNPSTNAYALSAFTVAAPSGWTFAGTPTGGTWFTCTLTSSAVSCIEKTSGNPMPPGGSDTLTGVTLALSTGPSTVKAVSGSFSTSVQDASSSAYYSGPKVTEYDTDSGAALAITYASGDSCKSGTFTAGSSACSPTITLSTTSGNGIQGLPVALTTDAHSSVTPSSATTSSSGTVGATFTPSNYVKYTPSALTATLGTSTVAKTSSIIIAASSPSAVAIGSITADTASNGVDYSNTMAATTALTTNINGAQFGSSTIQFSLNDAFGNPVSLASLTSWTITLQANGGGAFDASTTGASLITSLSCTDTYTDWETTATPTVPSTAVACPTGAGPFNVPYNYYQGLTYSNTTSITLSVSGTGFTARSAISNSLITSTFLTPNSPAPVPTPTSVLAGKSTKVTVTLTGALQKGVPVTIYLNGESSYATTSGAEDYTSSGFTGGTATSITNSTDKNGVVEVTFAVDTLAKATAYFNDTVAAPSNANGPTGALTGSGDSTGASTTAGSVASFIVTSYYTGGSPPSNPTTKSVNASTLYLDAVLADKYGNAEGTCSQTQQIQVNLAQSGVGSGGLLSATSVYIAPGKCDTAASGSYGPIQWTMPNAFGNVTVTANAVINGAAVKGTDKVTVYSPVPSMAIVSPVPLSNVIYSKNVFTSFGGWAAVSTGVQQSATSCTSPNDCVTTIDYGYTSGSTKGSGSAIFSAANNATWSVAISLPTGLSTVTFNATDANGFTVKSATFTVLVDTSAPDINFATAANANLTSGTTVTANVVDKLGDLNATSVSAVATNIDTSATKTLTASVNGTNSPGNSVTYGVALSGLTTGNWSVKLSATDYAGNTNSSTLTVHVRVSFSQSFVITGTPTSTTIGGFPGISASYQNLTPTSQSVVVFAVFKNSAGQTAGIGTGSLTVGAGSTQSVFIADPIGLASGTYTVNIFVFTTGNLPVSVSTTISVTV